MSRYYRNFSLKRGGTLDLNAKTDRWDWLINAVFEDLKS
jgi:hypothetical protein